MTPLAKGVALCLLSQILFAVLYLFSHWMRPINGTGVFALRMPAMAAGLWLMALYAVGARAMASFALRLWRGGWKTRLLFLTGTADVGSQFWLFMWAPVNGEGVNVATGYFLFPLVMVLVGRLWRKERPSRLQSAALACAAAGVAHELWAAGSFSWATLWVCGLYPVYYVSRVAMKTPALQGLTLDLTLLAPFALWLLGRGNTPALVAAGPPYWLLVPLLGLFSALAMSASLKAGQLLPVSLFGMLSYVEPALLFLAAVLVLHTPVPPSSYLTYGLIWAGLLLLAAHGWKSFRRPPVQA